MEVEATCDNGHRQKAILCTFVNRDGDRLEITGYFKTNCKDCGGGLTHISVDEKTATTAREVIVREENELQKEDYKEFEEVNRLVGAGHKRVRVPGGEAFRRTDKNDRPDTLVVIQPLDYGYRYTHFRIDTTGDEDRLVRKALFETVHS